MTDHADTIRQQILCAYEEVDGDVALAALDALVAERQQAIDALRTTEEWAHELGHDELAQRLGDVLLGLGELDE